MEVIEDNVDGFLFEVGQTSAMAEAGVALLTDPERLGRFKASAARRALNRFEDDKIVTQYERYYRKVLGE